MTGATHRPVTIVVADDDLVDRQSLVRAFTSAGLANPIVEVESGEALLALLREPADGVKYATPGLIVLDLNMPGMDGRAVLEKMSDDPRVSHIPVVVLTASEDIEDIRRAYLHGAVSFVSKPVTLDSIRRVVASLDGYSLAIVREV